MVGFPLAPWHMWGSKVVHSDTFQAVSPNPFDVDGKTVQLARVTYARPDTWSFLFGLIVTDAPASGLTVNCSIRADFIVTAGLGRSSITMANGIGDGRGFCRLTVPWSTPLTQRLPWGAWTSVAIPPPHGEVGDLRFLQNFPAQDIQCQAQVFGTSGVELLGQGFACEVHSYFAPRTHMRPEWFAEHGTQFRGNETGGT